MSSWLFISNRIVIPEIIFDFITLWITISFSHSTTYSREHESVKASSVKASKIMISTWNTYININFIKFGLVLNENENKSWLVCAETIIHPNEIISREFVNFWPYCCL